MWVKFLQAIKIPDAIIDFATHYQLAAYGLVIMTLAFLQVSPIPGIEIVENMRWGGVVVGMALVIVSVFRPRNKDGDT